MNKDTQEPAKERIKLNTSYTVYLSDQTKEKIWDLIDRSEDKDENPSTVIRKAIDYSHEYHRG